MGRDTGEGVAEGWDGQVRSKGRKNAISGGEGGGGGRWTGGYQGSIRCDSTYKIERAVNQRICAKNLHTTCALAILRHMLVWPGHRGLRAGTVMPRTCCRGRPRQVKEAASVGEMLVGQYSNNNNIIKIDNPPAVVKLQLFNRNCCGWIFTCKRRVPKATAILEHSRKRRIPLGLLWSNTSRCACGSGHCHGEHGRDKTTTKQHQHTVRIFCPRNGRWSAEPIREKSRQTTSLPCTTRVVFCHLRVLLPSPLTMLPPWSLTKKAG